MVLSFRFAPQFTLLLASDKIASRNLNRAGVVPCSPGGDGEHIVSHLDIADIAGGETDADSARAVDDTGFLKKGEHSVGVARQYSGASGRARGILLSLAGWTSAAIGEALRVRDDTVRNWRSAFMREGLEAVVRHPAPGRAPVKAQAALAVAGEVLAAVVENRVNWTLLRLSAEIDRRTGQRISRSRLSVVSRKKEGFACKRPRHTLKGRQDPQAVDRSGLRRQLLKAQALAGESCLFADESEALTHPYPARAWARRGFDLRIEAPGQAHKVAMTAAPRAGYCVMISGPIKVFGSTVDSHGT